MAPRPHLQCYHIGVRASTYGEGTDIPSVTPSDLYKGEVFNLAQVAQKSFLTLLGFVFNKERKLWGPGL